jgi:hypothetical protein
MVLQLLAAGWGGAEDRRDRLAKALLVSASMSEGALPAVAWQHWHLCRKKENHACVRLFEPLLVAGGKYHVSSVREEGIQYVTSHEAMTRAVVSIHESGRPDGREMKGVADIVE